MKSQTKQVSMTEKQIRVFIDSFAKQASKKYDRSEGHGVGHAYVSGYLQSMVTQLLAELPLKKQLHHIAILQGSSVWSVDNNG
jgi:hypothetical protein